MEPKHSLYRAIHHMNRGGLHRALHVPENEDIPKSKLNAAKHSSNSHIQHMVSLMHTLGGLNKK